LTLRGHGSVFPVLALLQPLDTVISVIASDKKAQRVGTALLVVDGTDEVLNRKAEISLTPGRVKARSLSKLVSLSREVYNATIQHRRDAWRLARVTVTRFDEFNEIPGLREIRPDVAVFGNQFVRGAISRADEAFAGFFRRLADGEAPGYPRFKSQARFRTVFYDEPIGWALRRLGDDDPALYVQGVGEIPLSASASRQLQRFTSRGGEPRTLTITKTRSGSWRACVGFRNVAVRPLPVNDQVGGVDRGITVTAALSDGTLFSMPAFVAEVRDEIAGLQRQRQQTQKFGPEWRKLNRSIAKAYHQAHNRSENWARHTAIEIVSRYGVVSIEALKLQNMTKSASGTKENPGTNVAAKRGLNRSLNDAALSRLAHWIHVKAEEAGRRVYKVDPRNSSRECACCGHTEAANRRRSRFLCRNCGNTEHADVNAAQVIAARGEEADAIWVASGSPRLTRPIPRNRRQKAKPTKQYGAGSAPHAQVA
jgi:putative transposase